jgi:hypothetical protein
VEIPFGRGLRSGRFLSYSLPSLSLPLSLSSLLPFLSDSFFDFIISDGIPYISIDFNGPVFPIHRFIVKIFLFLLYNSFKNILVLSSLRQEWFLSTSTY